MSDLIRIEYRDKNGDFYDDRSRTVIPNVGDHVQLSSGVYLITAVTWVEDNGPMRVVVEIGPKTKRAKYVFSNLGNW